MGVIMILAPFTILLGLVGLCAFWWTVRNGQYEDPQGDAERILIDEAEDRPL